MKRFLPAVIVALMAAAPATASSSSFLASLKKLDPGTRLEQICDYYAMKRIAHDSNPYRPDRAQTDVISHPHRSKNSVSGDGGAFRSGGHWYRFSYTCKTTPDHMRVLSFHYKIGDKIPESKWAKYGLWR